MEDKCHGSVVPLGQSREGPGTSPGPGEAAGSTGPTADTGPGALPPPLAPVPCASLRQERRFRSFCGPSTCRQRLPSPNAVGSLRSWEMSRDSPARIEFPKGAVPVTSSSGSMGASASSSRALPGQEEGGSRPHRSVLPPPSQRPGGGGYRLADPRCPRTPTDTGTKALGKLQEATPLPREAEEQEETWELGSPPRAAAGKA